MEKWDIRPTPSAHDPHRHLLLLRGGPSDVAGLLRKFGAMMGRPSPTRTEGFNLSLVLHRLTPTAREKLEAWLRAAAPPPAPPPPPAAAQPVAPDVAPEAMKPPTAAAKAVPPAMEAAAPAGLVLELRPDLTLETLLVGAFNRFAHAAAMSVVASPGSMYNPLFLHGMPGVGKSHMLNAIGSALAPNLGGTLLNTSGYRLSRAVNAALADKNGALIDKKVAASKALLIDDIHLMSVTDQNKEALAKIFKTFFSRQQQVVITSLYPPRSLGTLEEALKFSFSKGYSADLKVPNPVVQKELIAAAVDRSGAGFSSEEISLLHDQLSGGSYSDFALWLKRFIMLRKARETSGRAAALADLLHLIYDPLTMGGAEAPKPAAGAFHAPAAPRNAEPMAVIAPKGREDAGGQAAAAFYAVGGANGFPQVYRHALWETYDPAAPFGAPFLIGEMCSRAGVTRVLLVGPMPDSPLGPRAAEFAHATRHILESCGVLMGWIPFPGLSLAAHYLNAHLDLSRPAAKA